MATNHAVKQGDTLISIAHAHGFRDWRTLWDHDKNEPLRKKRSNPQVLYEGDVVHVPDPDPKTYVVATEKRHTFKLKRLPAFFSVRLIDECSVPYANKRYVLTVEGKRYEGMTSSDGVVFHEVEPDAKEGELKLWRDPDRDDEAFSWKMQIGSLDPGSEVSGAKARLSNLGFYRGPVDGQMTDETKEAIRMFQRALGYDPPSGELDERTRDALVKHQNHH